MHDGMCCCPPIFPGMTSSKMVHVLFVSYDEVIHRVNTCPLHIHVCKFQKHISGARVDLFLKNILEKKITRVCSMNNCSTAM